MSKQTRGSLLLLLTAAIWGSAFVAQKSGMGHVQPYTFNGVRMILAALALIPVIRLRDRRNGLWDAPIGSAPDQRRATFWGGLLCGLVLFVASSFQQFGVLHTTAGKAGFITALYLVMVPIIGLFLKRRAGGRVWLSVGIAVIGLWLLSVKGDFSMGWGDLLATGGAFWFAVHILVIDHFSPRVDGVRMACIQFFVCGVLALITMAVFETPSWGGILAAWKPILYAGLLSGGLGYTLQILAQRDTDPTVASLIMSLESVFAALAGGLLLGEVLSARELAGCGLMLAASILSQVKGKKSSG